MLNPISLLNPYTKYVKIVLAVAVFAAGFATAFHMQQGKIDDLHDKLGGYEVTINSMQALALESNSKIDELNKQSKMRQADAERAVLAAQAEAEDAGAVAHALMARKPPKGVNQCIAAQKDFSDSLRAERHIK
jgi:hypothetical protein